MLRPLTSLSLLLALAAPAAAASSAWIESEGGAIRIVSSGLSDSNGALRGALEIRLDPGWKTYWRNPGEAGVPPEINLAPGSDAGSVQMLFPAPQRISDRYATWAGYKGSTALPVVFTFPRAGMAGIIEGSVFLGICEKICIPVEVPFSFDAGADPQNAGDAATVESAFAALPEEPRPGFRVEEVKRHDAQVEFEVNLPDDAGEPALFLAPPEGVQIAMPELKRRDGRRAVFSANLLNAVAKGAALRIDYTLTAGQEAVAGQIALP
ncbi:protein-disulfide reductase DsbD domain-containing protein [Chelativorans sp. AA-79]|uniref:protein-disulfide reductase DsbD domain-containing protein n=1 Tax=Chelativorans sp. AA-79 TaxID=3028735 RepID=UPI0023F935B9|nr:protein-disulfide reductase DsbD domain-containing protein [Chelativorans sp. AA-79]WEX07818.1 protein-disulfide reductase DsbD family protein [Chelativorans sp. AA-79]